MSRLAIVAAAAALAAIPAQTPGPTRDARTGFSVVEGSIAEMQAAMAAGRTTSRDIVQQYLTRIAVYDGRLNATLYVNPRALDEADALDRERQQGRSRGPLHGIPIALKDNIHTIDMPTTGGALAFASMIPPYEATLTANLRAAGAIVIAKTAMTELANWVSPVMPGNYSALGGYGMNPYDARRDPRPGLFDGRPVLSPGGSSSGAGTAANLWAANVGTETSGSILTPANQTMLVGIKPTVGRISRHGVIPITADQDTPGPMAKFVGDAALLLAAMEGRRPDPNDAATGACAPLPDGDYARHLRPDALRGARIGIPRAFYYEAAATPGIRGATGGLDEGPRAAMTRAIRVLTEQGATVVDPAGIPSVASGGRDDNLLLWPVCSGEADRKGQDADCSIVFKYGMKRDFNAWLASLGGRVPVRTLSELRAWNRAHAEAGALKYGQAQLDISDEMDVEGDRARYLADRQKDLRLSTTAGLDAVLRQHDLDALLFPGSRGANVAARAGYPTVIVPFTTVAHETSPPLPAGFDARPAPWGVSFTGPACSEPRLIELAYAFEQATKGREAPPLD